MGESLSLQLDDELLQQLEKLARQEELETSVLVERVLRNWLQQRELRHHAVVRALREAEQGRFISREAIHEWMSSWDTENELPPPEPHRPER